MFKKGQAAMEFLMTYGWAILVVLIAIGALAYFGVLNPSRFIGERCSISTGSGIFCDQFNAVSSTDIVNIILRNGLSDTLSIPINGLVFTYDNGAATCTGPAAVTTIASEQTATITTGVCTRLFNIGEKLKGDLAISYTVGSSTLTRSTTGSMVISAG